MPLPDEIAHPTPAQAYELAEKHATLLRHLYNHPKYKYLEPPTATSFKLDLGRTPLGLYWVTDFVQNTFSNFIMPFLPPGAAGRCRALANPWAHADPSIRWAWEWQGEGEAGVLKDIVSGKAVAFPTLPKDDAEEKITDVLSRGFMTKKLVLENATDAKARVLLGGEAFDFGEDVRRLVDSLD